MKIAIDKGHGVGQDRGAVGFIAEEEIINNVGTLVVNKLRSLGHQVLEVRPASASSVSDSLAQRYNSANNWGAEIYVSIHANAGGGTGTEVYTYNAEKLIEAQRYMQLMLQEGFVVHSSNRQDINSGIKDGSSFAVINGTKMKAMLVETVFVDNQSDVNFYRNNIESFANAIVYGITGVDLRSRVNVPTSSERQFKIDLFAHIQAIGNVNVSGINDATIGTIGERKRMEAIAINIQDVDIVYDTYIQDIGNVVGATEGQIQGSIGQEKKIEAITINVRIIPFGYKLQYQAHVQDIGWQEWKESGQLAGTTGRNLRLEALRVRIIKV